MIDETALKVLKDQYISTSEFYSQLVDSLQDYSIFTIDQNLKINSWSSGSSNIFGYDTDEVIGKDFDIIFSEKDKENGAPQSEISTASAEGRAVGNRWHVRKDGSEFYAYGLVFPLVGLKGEMLGYVKILRDLTQRRLSENAIKRHMAELEALNIHKESVLAILSHDLRSPLAGIIGTAEYLRANFERMETEEVKEMLGLLSTASADELAMLDYLVEWARVKYASEIFSPSYIKLSPAVKKVFEGMGEAALTNGINLHNEIDENAVVFGDEKMLRSILQNLTSNSIKYTPRGGAITILSEFRGDKIVVEIRDTGIGMPKEIIERLFILQTGSLAKVRQKDKGAGIGLLLVKGFLEKNGGEIWAESKEGKGSSFYFSFPTKKPVD